MALHKKSIIRLILLTLILITIFSSFQITNVIAQSTIRYTFNESVYYDENTFIPDLTRNVRNQTHFTDIYNGSYSFTYDVNGTIPNDFNDISTLTCNAEVISDRSGHDKVLELNDTDAGQAGVRTWITNKTSGIVEFWVYTTGNNKYTQFLLWDLTENTGINFLVEWNTGQFSYHNGSIVDITTHYATSWYHIKIVYDFTTDWGVYINGEAFLGLDWAGTPNKIDKIDIQTQTTPTSFYTYIDAIGYSWDGNYNENDNIVPYNYLNETLEPDKNEFYNNDDGSETENNQEVIPFWDELLTGGKIKKAIGMFDDTTCVYFYVHTSNADGLERTFDVSDAIITQINFSFGWVYAGTHKTYITIEIDSYDDTNIIKLRIDDNAVLGDLRLNYYDGSSYIEIQDLTDDTDVLKLNITIISNLVICETGSETAIFSVLSYNKAGIGDVKITLNSIGVDYPNMNFYIDSIGVYIDGISLCNDFGNYYYSVGTQYNNKQFNLFELNATGSFGLGVSSFDTSNLYNFFDYHNVENTTFKNCEHESEVWVIYSYIRLTTNTNFTINSIFISGVSMTDGVDNYIPTIDDGGINNNDNYFYVDSSNRLRFSLTVNDNDTEYIEINFNIPDIQTENYSVSFLSNMDGSSLGFLRVMYTDDTSSFIPFPTWLSTTNVIIPQTRELESIGVLITDNDNDDNDYAYGYITELQLIWYTDMRVSIITLNLMMVIVPIMVLLVPTFGISARYGKNTILPVFILMTIICFATSLIPIWVFFVIMLSAGAFLFMKRKGSDD